MTTDEARQAVDQEATLIDVIDAIARDAAEFDDIASAAEFGKPQDIGVADIRQQPGWPTLDESFPGEEGTDTGLELGVGGLAYALAAVGLVPVASCRSHAASPSWSDAPVVFFATNRTRASVLQPLVAKHRCGLDYDDVNRPQFMTITAPDVRTMNRLAAAVLDAADEFGPGTIISTAEGLDGDTDVADPDSGQLILPGLPDSTGTL